MFSSSNLTKLIYHEKFKKISRKDLKDIAGGGISDDCFAHFVPGGQIPEDGACVFANYYGALKEVNVYIEICITHNNARIAFNEMEIN